jgi:hypothetical protein
MNSTEESPPIWPESATTGSALTPTARDARVGLLLLLVALAHGLLVRGERVAVLHDELAAAHEAEARAQLVAELVLHLVEGHGQLLVAAELVAHEVGERLLVRGAERELAVVAVGSGA